MKSILKEPVFHFLVLGAGLFALSALRGDPGEGRDEKSEIVITPGRVDSLVAQFEKVWQRPPTPKELNGVIEEHLREEILYREALALGLDRDDTIVRRRMRQKIEFLTDDITDLAEPGEEELESFLRDNAEEFRTEAEFTFRQIYLDPEKHGESLETDAAKILEKLRGGNGDVNFTELGDRTLLQSSFESIHEKRLGGMLGKDFVEALSRTETGSWAGPVRSAYGAHLVYLSERVPGKIPSLEEVRDAVTREWSLARRSQMREDFYNELRKKYTITIERGEAGGEEVEASWRRSGICQKFRWRMLWFGRICIFRYLSKPTRLGCSNDTDSGTHADRNRPRIASRLPRDHRDR